MNKLFEFATFIAKKELLEGLSLEELQSQIDYHLGRIKINNQTLVFTKAIDIKEGDAESERIYKNLLSMYEENKTAYDAEMKSSKSLREQAEKFKPKNKDLNNFINYLPKVLDQVDRTILNKYQGKLDKPKLLLGEKWRVYRIDMLNQSNEYHSKLSAEKQEKLERLEKWFSNLEKEFDGGV